MILQANVSSTLVKRIKENEMISTPIKVLLYNTILLNNNNVLLINLSISYHLLNKYCLLCKFTQQNTETFRVIYLFAKQMIFQLQIYLIFQF